MGPKPLGHPPQRSGGGNSTFPQSQQELSPAQPWWETFYQLISSKNSWHILLTIPTSLPTMGHVEQWISTLDHRDLTLWAFEHKQLWIPSHCQTWEQKAYHAVMQIVRLPSGYSHNSMRRQATKGFHRWGSVLIHANATVGSVQQWHAVSLGNFKASRTRTTRREHNGAPNNSNRGKDTLFNGAPLARENTKEADQESSWPRTLTYTHAP